MRSHGAPCRLRWIDTGKPDTEGFMTVPLRPCSARRRRSGCQVFPAIAVWNFLQEPSYRETADCVSSVGFSRTLQQYPKVAFSKLRHDLCSRDRLQLGVGTSARHLRPHTSFKKTDSRCILFVERVHGALNTSSIHWTAQLCGPIYL